MRGVGESVKKPVPSPTPASQAIPKARNVTGVEGAIARGPSHGSSLMNSDGYENTWGGKLGMLAQDFGQ